MRRIAAIIVGAVVVLLVASQLALPPLAERAAADRLTRDGGTAHVSLSALPALRLLFGEGDSLRVDGRGIRLPTEGQKGGLGKLDQFGEVRIRLNDVSAGPLSIRRLRLERPAGSSIYSAQISAETTPRELGAFLGSQAGGGFGAVLGDLAAGIALPGGAGAKLPLDLSARVESRNGQHQVSAVSGAVARVPAGPLLELVLDAVVRRL